MIIVNQKIGLETTFTKSGAVVDISSGVVVFEYYLPGNSTAVKDGEISGVITSGPDGTATGEFPSSLNVSTGTLRVQGVVTISGDTYRAKATSTTIYPIGC